MRKIIIGLGGVVVLAVCAWAVDYQKNDTSKQVGRYQMFISPPVTGNINVLPAAYLLDTQTAKVWLWSTGEEQTYFKQLFVENLNR